ncbi:MAG: hypothetical protein A2Z95_01850 [Gallionellales bacterium GWA2_60_18]|nr:MAG: hypothetical protein A2Z95_01850 [Gallionellales bacterium GWA2_60_18]
MHPFKQFLNSIASRLLADVSGHSLAFLMHPLDHSALLTRYRAEMIISRVRLVSAMFAVLTPLWIIMDFLVFDSGMAVLLAGARLATTLGFVVLALAYRGSPHMKDAYRALAFMFIIPTSFFIFSHLLLADIESSGSAAVIAAGYAFLPFVLVAGLSVFPLTALEGIVFSMPVLFGSALVAIVQINQINWSTHLGAFWLLVLIAATATLAGMSQLAFMLALVRQANHDPLTGCYNRASGEDLFNIQFSIAERNDTALTIVFVDLDNFKSVNDTYGHEAGDRVLISAVRTIRESLRAGDALVRWGGEEFLIMLPNTDCASAVAVLDRLRTNGLGLRPDGGKLTASYGLAERISDGAADSRQLLEIADQRMYCAKEGGRDRWIGCDRTDCSISNMPCARPGGRPA